MDYPHFGGLIYDPARATRTERDLHERQPACYKCPDLREQTQLVTRIVSHAPI